MKNQNNEIKKPSDEGFFDGLNERQRVSVAYTINQMYINLTRLSALHNLPVNFLMMPDHNHPQWDKYKDVFYSSSEES